MVRDTRHVDERTLQEYLLRDAERLRRYIAAKIPTDLGGVVMPDDVLQEVWIAAFRGWPTFRNNGTDALARWLTTLANRRLVDAFRATRALKRRRRRADVGRADRMRSSMADLLEVVAHSLATPSSEASSKEAVHAVRLALAGLPDEWRRAISLHHLEGRSVAETACQMQKTEGAVRGLLHRARKELCGRLGRESRFFSDVPRSGKTAR